jgi:flagellar hook-associated protein 3 FlgL
MIGRIGDAAQSDRLMTALQSTTARLRSGQIAAATGKRATRYDEIARESGLLLRTKDQRALTTGFRQQNEQVVDRLTAMDGALANLGDIAQRLRTLLTQRLDAATGDLVPLDREALTLQAEAAAQLNLRLDERYLFAGSRNDTAPVELPAATLTSSDPSLYYRGDRVVQTVRADRDVEVSYGVTADEPAFGGLLAALGKAAQAHLANDRSGLELAATQVDAALNGIAELRGEVGATSTRLQGIAESQSSTVLYLDDIVTRIEDADVPQTLAQLAQDQAALEAAYLTTSRLGQLSLADYLR